MSHNSPDVVAAEPYRVGELGTVGHCFNRRCPVWDRVLGAVLRKSASLLPWIDAGQQEA